MINNKVESCPVYKKCGGCQLQNMTYSQQLTFKQNKVLKLLKRFGNVEPIIAMKYPYHYRNKVQAAFYTDKKGKIISGVYQSGSHHVVGIDSCQTEDVIADKIIVAIRKLLPSFKLTTYDEDKGRGFLRHVLIKRGFSTNQIMVVLVTGTPIFPSKNNFVKALRVKFPEITTIIQNVNPYSTNLVLGENQKVLYGKGYIEDTLCGCKFRISAKSFYQINPVQTEILYNTAMDFANLQGNETVLDTYCGTGTIGLIAAKRGAKRVIGVELNSDAVHDAIINSKTNNIKNIRFYKADASDFMAEVATENEKPDLVFMDPPRSGSTEKFMNALISMSPKTVVYVSCNPETLARDISYISKNSDYKVQKIQPVDMFPHTAHVETVCLLSKLHSDKHIEVELNMDELDLTAAESKATYEEIKDYVLKHTGLKVSNLYIAQVKKKCGIEVGESFNKPKLENAKQPKRPEDKEKAIKDALVHFGML